MKTPADNKTIRIGGASGFWGDSSVGAPQLVRQHGEIDYLVFDYLAELTMSLLAAARLKDPQAGYATDFVSVTMKSLLKEVVERGIKVISNAGGMNPRGCAEAVAAIAAEQGVDVKIAFVEGDDAMPLLDELRASGVEGLDGTRKLPDKLVSANAYLGALPIKHALDQGAQIVITGRCVDSAVTLGALMHEFGWASDDFDRLAQASLAGHILECGAQGSGGLFTDWESVPGWDNIGYPIVECRSDGSFVVCKSPDTGGLVSTATVAEQVLYEIGDPTRYLLPDVSCDFTHLALSQQGENRVEVRGARGRAPSASYKVSATYADGYRCTGLLIIAGADADAKARRSAQAILDRTRRLLLEAGLGDYDATHIDIIGSEACFGSNRRRDAAREAVMWLAVRHQNRKALELFAREIAPAGTSWAPGTAGGVGGRPSPSPSIKQYAFLLPKQRLAPAVVMNGVRSEVAIPVFTPGTAEADAAPTPAPSAAQMAVPAGPTVEVPLIRIAHGRSGDKGDISNIGLVARRKEWLAVLREQVTEASVKDYLSHFVKGRVTRYDLPGFDAVNFVCEQALGGGGMASLRYDPLGKSMAQILLTMPVQVPKGLL